MAKTIFEQMGGTYTLQSDYYLPNLTLPIEENKPIGIWGQRHLRYIREHKKALYTSLLTSGKLQSYLADVEEQAQELFDRLMKQLAEREGVTEQLKVEKPMLWVGRMNEIQTRAREIVYADIIYKQKYNI